MSVCLKVGRHMACFSHSTCGEVRIVTRKSAFFWVYRDAWGTGKPSVSDDAHVRRFLPFTVICRGSVNAPKTLNKRVVRNGQFAPRKHLDRADRASQADRRRAEMHVSMYYVPRTPPGAGSAGRSAGGCTLRPHALAPGLVVLPPPMLIVAWVLSPVIARRRASASRAAYGMGNSHGV